MTNCCTIVETVKKSTTIRIVETINISAQIEIHIMAIIILWKELMGFGMINRDAEGLDSLTKG